MRTPAQVANDTVTRVSEKMAAGADIGGSLWRTSIAEEVAKHQLEIAKVIVDTIQKTKGLKAKEKKMVGAEIATALEHK